MIRQKNNLSEMSQSEIVSHAWHRKLQFQLQSLSLLKIYENYQFISFQPSDFNFPFILSLVRVFSAIFETMFIKSMCSCAIRKHYEMKNRNSRFYDFLNELSAIFNKNRCFIFQFFPNGFLEITKNFIFNVF